VVGREAILRASCFADSIRMNGLEIEEKERKTENLRILRHQFSDVAGKHCLRLVGRDPCARDS
jgi:hypothetical protein